MRYCKVIPDCGKQVKSDYLWCKIIIQIYYLESILEYKVIDSCRTIYYIHYTCMILYCMILSTFYRFLGTCSSEKINHL